MMVVLIIPAILSFLIAAAHWLHSGNLPMVLVSLAAPFLLLTRARWSVRVIQVMLVLMALEWLRTTFVLMQERQANDEPWHRMAVILCSVAAFAILSAGLLSAPPLMRRFSTRPL